MIVAMINDCAYVGETIAKYLPRDVVVKYVRRGGISGVRLSV